MDDEIIRIMVATDNHLGFAERDPVRYNDSFAAFEEVLQNAQTNKVDFVLLAGDMFHENKPSRRTLHATMELLRTYCLGNQSVYIEVLNDQKEIFKTTLGKVNYEDPFQSVGLPVFSIHGNHDDPSREGGQSDSLAALDLLAVTNLINYFGKSEKVEDVEITPILIRKGTTNLAIYGLGAMRDERLNRMWNQKKVRFVRLTAEQGRDSFFNIFVLHQNRDYGRGKKNCVHESMIPEWMDLVIWGNEHECQPQLMESLVGTYRVLQPGSSIACSFSAGESSRCPKHMAFFEIKEKKFRMRPIPFTQVRHFIYEDLCLAEHVPALDPNHPKIDERIREIVTAKVNAMIVQGRSAVEEPLDAEGRQIVRRKYSVKDPHKILVRLRVDHDGYPSLNQQRFGAQYVGEVANPSDILLLAKKRKEIQRATERQNGGGTDWKAILADGAEEEIHKIKIEDLVNEMLLGGRHSLALMAETEMAQALDDYIVKKHANAILDLVSETLERTQAALNVDKSADDKAAISRAVERVKSKAEEDCRKGKQRAQPIRDFADFSEQEASAEEEQDDDSDAGPTRVKAKAKPKTATTATASAKAAPKVRTSAAATKKQPESKGSSRTKSAAPDPPKRAARATKKVSSYADEEQEEMDVESSDHFSPDEEEHLQDSSSDDQQSRKLAVKSKARGGASVPKPSASSKKQQVICLDESEEEGMRTGSSHKPVASKARSVVPLYGSAAAATQSGAVGGAKKRQLPSSFSQSLPQPPSATSQSVKKPPPSKNKNLTSGWDD